MKRTSLVLVLLVLSVLASAQNAAPAPGAPAQQTDSAGLLFNVIGVATVAVFIFVLIYSLARALKVLAEHTAAKG